MVTSRTKLLVGGLIAAGAVGYLAYAGVASGKSYYMAIDAFMSDPQYHSQHVRLHGKVGQDRLGVDVAGLKADFQLLGQTKSLPVSYHGAVPDLFKAGAEVVVEGRLGPEGVFKADRLLTKCASKYTEKAAAERPEKP